jgi:hypothetical protein
MAWIFMVRGRRAGGRESAMRKDVLQPFNPVRFSMTAKWIALPAPREKRFAMALY